MTGLGDAASASLQGAGGHRVRCGLIEGWTDLVVYAPPDQPSVALEPLTSTLSASSLGAGVPGAIPSLAPEQSLSGVMRLGIENERIGHETSFSHSQEGEHPWTA
jgi:hypothetical protein